MRKAKKQAKKKGRKKANKKAKKKILPINIGLLHTGSQAIFGQPRGPVDTLVNALPVDVTLPDSARIYAADLKDDLDTNINNAADTLAKDADTTYKLLVAAGGPESAQALQAALRKAGKITPVVFTTVTDPVGLGLVDDPTAPGHNLTGMWGQTSEKDKVRLRVLFEFARNKIGPKDIIGVLVANHRPGKDTQFQEVEKEGRLLGVQVKRNQLKHPNDVIDSNDIADAFSYFVAHDFKGVVVMADSLFNDLRPDVVRIANDSGLPTIYQWKQFVDEGGLISFGPDLIEAYKKAAEYVKRILIDKEDPATIPCSTPSKYLVHVNGHAAGILKIPIPGKLLGFDVNVI